MADKTTYFANFDGDEINGRRYGLGDPIDDDVDTGTLVYLAQTGRITATQPDKGALVEHPDAVDLPLGDMTRQQLESAALATINLSSYSDEELRQRIDESRRDQAARADRADTPPPSDTTGADTGEGEEGADPAAADRAAILNGNLSEVEARVAAMDSVEALQQLRDDEAAGKKRTGALSAIDARITALKPAD
jgi:hypothetical protein